MVVEIKKGAIFVDGENEVVDCGKPLFIKGSKAVIQNCRFYLRIFKHPAQRE